jgi:hypothetical protein
MALTMEDIDLSCSLCQGIIVECEVICNSAFMLENLPLNVAELCQNLHWVHPEESIYLVIDNAGGHGAQEVIEECTWVLLEKFNIVIIWQSARSPEENALDFGIWMSVQSHAERRSCDRCRDPDSLAISVEEAWNNLPIEEVQQLFNRIYAIVYRPQPITAQ